MKDRHGRPFIKSVQEILEEYGQNLTKFLHDQYDNDRANIDHSGTNITAALKLARDITDAAIAGSLATYGVTHPVSLMAQPVGVFQKPAITVPNVRAMIYSDGAHNQGPLVNAFEGMQPASVLMTAFIGDEEATAEARTGADQMKALANICPTHNQPGYFLINTLGRRAYLRQLYHMTTGASGFCPSCLINKAGRLQAAVGAGIGQSEAL
jgi:hypothetical protein